MNSIITPGMNENDIICQTFQEYAKVFENLKPREILAYYDYPAILIKPDTKPKTFNNTIAGLAIFFFVTQDLRKKQYKRSEMSQLSVKQLSSDLALVSGVARRININEKEFESFAFTYTMRKTIKGWKIIVATIHDKETVLSLENYC